MNMGVALNFDANTVAPNVPMDPVPSGWYNAQITESSMEPTSKPGGQMLSLVLTILDGPYAQRKLFDRLNLVNENPTAVEIAFKTLSSICRATGIMQCANSQQLHGIPMKVKVKLRNAEVGKDGKNYDASNEVRGYDTINSDHDTTVAGPVVPGVAGAPGGVPPWAAAAAPPAAGAASFPAGVPAYVPPGPAMAAPTARQPWVQPGQPAPAAPVAAVFPPEGWLAHPTASGYFYCGQEVLTEADLRARFPAPPAAPVAPPATPAAPSAPGVAPWVRAAAAAPAAPVAAAPAAPLAPAPPQVATATGPVMLPAANGIPYESYKAQGWTDEAMIANGIIATPAAPSAPGVVPAPAGPASATPPWAR